MCVRVHSLLLVLRKNAKKKQRLAADQWDNMDDIGGAPGGTGMFGISEEEMSSFSLGPGEWR